MGWRSGGSTECSTGTGGCPLWWARPARTCRRIGKSTARSGGSTACTNEGRTYLPPYSGNLLLCLMASPTAFQNCGVREACSTETETNLRWLQKQTEWWCTRSGGATARGTVTRAPRTSRCRDYRSEASSTGTPTINFTGATGCPPRLLAFRHRYQTARQSSGFGTEPRCATWSVMWATVAWGSPAPPYPGSQPVCSMGF